jgi:hypothetical protein
MNEGKSRKAMTCNREAGTMLYRSSTETSAPVAVPMVAALIVTALMVTMGSALAFDDAKYPDWKGKWSRIIIRGVEVQGAFDQTKPFGPGQQAPLTPEYQKVLERSMADQAAGGLGNYPTARCLPSGMPRMMTFGAHEYVITPETTYILLEWDHQRRVFTDGRTWPQEFEPTYGGYSIGKWIDEDGDGRFDVLEVETRDLRGPRILDASGTPAHADNQSVIKERIYLDKSSPDLLHDEMTMIDHAFTRPWPVMKTFRRKRDGIWTDNDCADNGHVAFGNDNYFVSGDGYLMPTKKNQPPPDLRYFKQTRK